MTLPRVLTSLLIILGVTAAAFVGLCLLLYFWQERFIFYPQPNDPQLAEQWKPYRLEIPSGDTSLEGWRAVNPDARTDAVILYFGGNAEDVLYTLAGARQIEAKELLAVNYRGYGATRGKPSQRALFADALAIYDHVVAKEGIDARNIVVMGRSLGSGIAAMLASERSVRAAILITPYDSLVNVAARHYAIFPVRWLLKHPFPSAEFAQRTRVPALMVAAEYDTIVPPSHAQRLHEAWKGESKLHVLNGVGHNDIERHPDYYALINSFLVETLGEEVRSRTAPRLTD
jgi:pimeloyl-ACP methyl ester carboxylesterase